MSDLLGNDDLTPEGVRAMFEALLDRMTPQPHVPLLSPRCGLHGQHAECRSVICECRCHWEALLS